MRNVMRPALRGDSSRLLVGRAPLTRRRNPLDPRLVARFDFANYGLREVVTGTDAGFQRASKAWVLDNGALREFAIDEPRILSDGSLLLEPAGTGLAPRGGDILSADTTGFPQIIDIGEQWHGLDVARVVSDGVDWSRARSSAPSVISGMQRRYTIIAREGTSGQVRGRIYNSEGLSCYIHYNFTTDEATQASTGMTSDGATATSLADGWVLVEAKFTPTADFSDDSWGVSPHSDIAGEYVDVAFTDVQNAPFGSPIVNKGSGTTTRATEAADASGNGFSWLMSDDVKAALQSEGTMVLRWAPAYNLADVSPLSYPQLIQIKDSIAGGSPLYHGIDSNQVFASYDDGRYNTQPASFSAHDNILLGVRWDGSTSQLFHSTNSEAISFGSEDTTPAKFIEFENTLRLFAIPYRAMTVQTLSIYNTALTQAEIEAL